MSNAQAADDALVQLELERRRQRLVIIAPCAAIVCLASAIGAAIVLHRGSPDFWLVSIIAVPVGAILGLAHAPILCVTIARKKQVLALPLIYGVALFGTAAVASSGVPIWSVVTLGLLVPLLALLATALPNDRLLQSDLCRHCGYNLSVQASDVCPECGMPIGAPPGKPERNGV